MRTAQFINFDFVILRRQRAYFSEECSQFGGNIDGIIRANGENGADALSILKMV